MLGKSDDDVDFANTGGDVEGETKGDGRLGDDAL